MNNKKNDHRTDLSQALIHLDKKRERIHLKNDPEIALIDQQTAKIITMILGVNNENL